MPSIKFSDGSRKNFSKTTNGNELAKKISSNLFLVVDPHQPYHGTVNIYDAKNYILLNNIYKGVIEWGYSKNYFT